MQTYHRVRRKMHQAYYNLNRALRDSRARGERRTYYWAKEYNRLRKTFFDIRRHL
jgi:hypothetical protein